MMDNNPFRTQRDVGSAVVTELRAAGFDDADEIGRGGFGIVYRCTQIALDRTVAVKVLTAELDENRERFLREQRAMGRLTGHPNIVSVLQVGETQSGYPYLVMQYHRHGSLEARIGQLGPLPLDEVLRLGVKMAGALGTAHRLEILHRDVKPANILLTNYGEPALGDFGIAHISGGFKTATGTFTGSPAFTAPELLSGDPPSRSSDVYGLGATLFCALTGHAAFERRSGEQMVAQFLRIASESAPDLRDNGIPDDVAAVVERAMSRAPKDRLSAAGLGEEIQGVQARYGFAVDEMALEAASGARRPEPRAAVAAGPSRNLGNLPLDLTSFVGRRTELAEVMELLSNARLVTLTGIGGVGKTRLALRAAADAAADFCDGVRLVELGELRDSSLLVDVVAAGLGVRDASARPLIDVLVEFLRSRQMLLLLDNCEQVVEAAAKLTDAMLRACPQLRILATSREAIGIGGESVRQLSPLSFPDDSAPTPDGLSGYDAVALFAERAGSAVPGFCLTDENKATVARICSRLDGLPLAIELAAARLRAMSPEQILERLADRYTLLTRGSRGAPARQQTLGWSIGWSYDLCAPAEQQLWGRLSVFAGSFELEAAEDICGSDLAPGDIDDLVSALVEKSILMRTETKGVVRFRILETLRAYGRERIQQTGTYTELRRRHRDWYRRLLLDAEAEWFSSQQVHWIQRIEREMPNLREALEFSLSDNGETALGIVAGLQPIWISRGMLSEGRRWLDPALGGIPPEPTADRIKALYGAATIAGIQGDVPAAEARVTEARALVQQMADPAARGLTDVADAYTALLSGKFERTYQCCEDALNASDDPIVRAGSMLLMAWALEFEGDIGRALIWGEKALAFAESHGESVYRTYALWNLGVGWWRQGQPDRGEQLLRQCLQLTQRVNDPRHAAACLEALAWIAQAEQEPRRAVVLMGAADEIGRAVGASTAVFPNLVSFHEECERSAREALYEQAFETAYSEGGALSIDDAVAFALGDTA
ncbi:MAG TPA: protein kinase [Mycobacterium sp.]|nr:protein kinase [Mycobacterium sp.]